ncbi:MAG: ribonuclease P protein component [Candidatus Kaiserbacteria bacterium]|nr:ribonuclease P protein component [Candidatus Kaiserbacteria bacterium]
MFPQRERLPRAKFPAALSSGRRLSSVNFSVVLPKEAHGYAVIVSKKVARLSVTRHLIKRRVLVTLRALAPRPPALIVFPKAPVSKMSVQDIKAELAVLLSKIR